MRESGVLYAPGKASNAGGMAVSEISQNMVRMSWSAEEVNERLQFIMKEIHNKFKEHGKSVDEGKIDDVK